MTSLHDKIAKLRRPKLLIRAARFGLTEYRRAQVLHRLRLTSAQNGQPQPQVEIVERLFEMEARSEAQRQSGDPAYRVAHHVELMIALMAEVSLLGAPEQGAAHPPEGPTGPSCPRPASAPRPVCRVLPPSPARAPASADAAAEGCA